MDAARVKQSQKKLTERGREDVAETRHTGRAAGSVAPQIVQGVHDARMAGRLARAVSLVRDGKPLVRALSLARREVHAISCVCVPMCTVCA